MPNPYLKRQREQASEDLEAGAGLWAQQAVARSARQKTVVASVEGEPSVAMAGDKLRH